MSEMTLRSNQIISMTETMSTPKTTMTLTAAMITAATSTPLANEGIGHQLTASTLTSQNGATVVDESRGTGLVDRRGVELDKGDTARDSGVGGRRAARARRAASAP